MTSASRLRRLFLLTPLLLPLALAACGASDTEPMSYPRVNYDYLTKLRLNVASVDIDDSLTTPPDMSRMAPIKPVDALRQMAQDRLVAQGSTGRAVFVVDEASITQAHGRLEGRMTAHLDVTTSDGARSGYAEARVSRSSSFDNDGPNATRLALNNLVNQMMTDMNVEFEFQVRRSLRSYLQAAPTPPPPPAQIQTEILTAPPKS